MAITTQVFYTTNASLPEDLSLWELATEPYTSQIKTIPSVAPGLYYVKVRNTDGVNYSPFSSVYTVTVVNAPASNNAPTVANPIADQNRTAGYGSFAIALANVFADADSDALTYSAVSSNTALASVSVTGSTLTVTEGTGTGSATITVTANDGKGGTINDVLTLQVTGAANTTPAPPTLTADDTADTLAASHALGTSEILVSENNGAYAAYTGPISVGNVARAAGYWKFKIKSATGRNESSVVNSPAFTFVAPPSLSGTELVFTLPTDSKYGDAVVDPDGIAYFPAFDSKKIERVDLNTWTLLTPLTTLSHAPVGISLYGDTLLVSRSGANGWFEVNRFTGATTTKSTLASGRKVVRIGDYYYIQNGTGMYVANSAGAFIVQPNAGTTSYDLAVEGEYLYMYRASFLSRTLPYLPERAIAFSNVSGTGNNRYVSGRFIMTPRSVVIALDTTLTSDAANGNVGNNIFAYSRDFSAYYGGAKVPDEAYTNALFRFGVEVYGVTLPGKIYRVLANTPV